jgi:molecular chaperone GrpE
MMLDATVSFIDYPVSGIQHRASASAAAALGFLTPRQFVPLLFLGNILDNLTFADNFEIMTEKHTKKKAPENQGDVEVKTGEQAEEKSSVEGAGMNESEVEKLKTELEEMKDRYLRNVADFENFKRRNAKERLELIQTAGKEVITDLLDVLDDCDRAQKQIETSNDIKEIKEGVLLVFNKLRNVLQSRGLKPMETISKEFDPDLHEAITEIPAPTPELKGKVVDEVMKGYYLNDKIIRHAKVVVGK